MVTLTHVHRIPQLIMFHLNLANSKDVIKQVLQIKTRTANIPQENGIQQLQIHCTKQCPAFFRADLGPHSALEVLEGVPVQYPCGLPEFGTPGPKVSRAWGRTGHFCQMFVQLAAQVAASPAFKRVCCSLTEER